MLGAREHYAPITMAEKAGWLSCFVTDLWSPWGPAVAPIARKLRFDALSRVAERYSPDIPSHKVRCLTTLGLRYKGMQALARTRKEMYSIFERTGSDFARIASNFVSNQQDVFFGYSSSSLETLQRATELGLRTVLDQIDPGRIEYDIVATEEREYPDLSPSSNLLPERYFSRIQREWEIASAVIVNSAWSKRALAAQGVPGEKLFVVPLAYGGPSSTNPKPPRRSELRVLWLGTLCLRKGLVYALQAARMLAGFPVTFTFAGACQVKTENLRFPTQARYVGPVTRAEAARLYDKHDIFIFPTLSDGFGLTQIEALSYGLPVITTLCCGDVIEHGKSGFLIPPREPRALAEAILRFAHEPDLLPMMSAKALERSIEFRPEAIWPYYAAVLMGTPRTFEDNTKSLP